MRRTVYMDKNMLTLFIEVARNHCVLSEYVDKEQNEDLDEEEEFYMHGLEKAHFAYSDTLQALRLEDEYERFKLIILDSQMEYIEECGKYDKAARKKYTDDYALETYDPNLFGDDFLIEEHIFENGWDFDKLYAKCTAPDDKILSKVRAKHRDFTHNACKQLFDIWLRDRNVKMRMKSYATLEDVAKHARFSIKYQCEKCGAIYYSDYRRQYDPAPRCLKCGDNTDQKRVYEE
jgi:phage pi2 protein 07